MHRNGYTHVTFRGEKKNLLPYPRFIWALLGDTKSEKVPNELVHYVTNRGLTLDDKKKGKMQHQNDLTFLLWMCVVCARLRSEENETPHLVLPFVREALDRGPVQAGFFFAALPARLISCTPLPPAKNCSPSVAFHEIPSLYFCVE